MAFDDVARRMAKRHDAALPPLAMPASNAPVKAPSALYTHLLIAAGILIMIGSGMMGLFLLGDRLFRKLAVAGVVIGIAMIVSATRRD